jgi:hypothetical protein
MRETLFATQLELYRNKEQWEELRNFYIARRELKQIIKGVPRILPEILVEIKEVSTPTRQPDEEDKPTANAENALLGNV